VGHLKQNSSYSRIIHLKSDWPREFGERELFALILYSAGQENYFTLIWYFITFKLDGEVTSLSGSSQGEVEDNRKKWGDFWEKLMVINRNIVLWPLMFSMQI
jgi:hypothetical protein